MNRPLAGYRIVVVAVNIPGPVAASRFAELGARVTKIEPPDGDPVAKGAPGWYASLHADVEVVALDLKQEQDRRRCDDLLETANLLLTSYRPQSLERMGLSWDQLKGRFPNLSQILILGEEAPFENRPGHDLTYQAQLRLLSPPEIPRTLVADMAGAQEAVIAGLTLLLERSRGAEHRCAVVSLKEAAARFAESFRRGLTAPGGILGGGIPGYNMYPTRDGWVSLAAIEPRFLETLCREWNLTEPSVQAFAERFLTQTAIEWEEWAAERDIPLAAVR